MSTDITGVITWIRSFLDDVYAEKGSSGSDLEIELVPKSENSNGILCVTGGELTYDLDKVYPVGSIYMSVNSANPSTLFGGTWVQLTDTFLYATSTTSDANVTTAPTGQGSKDAVVVEHTHELTNDGQILGFGTTGSETTNGFASGSMFSNSNKRRTTIKSSGESGTDKNMPPYMKVYMWKRTQ